MHYFLWPQTFLLNFFIILKDFVLKGTGKKSMMKLIIKGFLENIKKMMKNKTMIDGWDCEFKGIEIDLNQISVIYIFLIIIFFKIQIILKFLRILMIY